MFGRGKKIKSLEAKIQSIEQKSFTIPITEGSFLEFALGGGGRILPAQAMEFYRSNSALATAVDMIADSFEQIDPVIQNQDGSFETQSEVLNLLKSPNGFNVWQDFSGKIARDYLLTHNVHLTATGNIKRPPLELWENKPQWISVSQAMDQYPSIYSLSQGPTIGSYRRTQEGRNVVRFFAGKFTELFHIMGYSSRNDELWGDSPIEAAALEARQHIQGKNHNLKLLNNGGRLSLLVQFKDTMNDDEHLKRKQRLKEQFGGSDNAGAIGVISSKDMDIKEFGVNNKDMDYAELEKTAALAIYMRYKIPLPLVSTDASTFNNMEQAIEMLYDWAVIPLANTLFSGLTSFLMPRYGIDPTKVRITFNPESIQALKVRRLNELEQRKKIGIESINELRELLPNRDKVDGGEVIYQPATLVPVGTDPFTDNQDAVATNQGAKA